MDRLAEEIYLHCSDDESRRVLYSGQADELDRNEWYEGFELIKNFEGLPNVVRESLETILSCRIPAWKNPTDILTAKEREIQLLFVPTKLQEWLFPLSPYYCDLLPKETAPDPSLIMQFYRGFSLARRVIPICSRIRSLFPVLDYNHLYDALLMSAWHDGYHENETNIEFRPRWTLRPNGDATACMHVPDVVVSALVPCPTSSKLRNQLQRIHPEHYCQKSSLASRDFITVPLLIAEYLKCSEKFLDSDMILNLHLDHLAIGMVAALEIYKAYSIRSPLLGLLFSRYEVRLYAAYVSNGEVSFKRLCLLHACRPYEINNRLQCILLQSAVSNIRCSVQEVRSKVQILDHEHEYMPPLCEKKLHAMGPCIVDDDSCLIAYNEPQAMKAWLSSRLVTIASSHGSSGVIQAPTDADRALLSSFLQYRLPSSISEQVAKMCQACLSPPEVHLWDEFASNYESGRLNLPDAELYNNGNNVDLFSKQVSESITVTSVARIIARHDAGLSSWSTLIDSMLSLPMVLEGPRWTAIRYSATLTVHRSHHDDVRDALEVFDKIVVDIVIVAKRKTLFGEEAFSSYPVQSREQFLHDFSIYHETGNLERTCRSDVDIPILLVEHVKSPFGREQHLQHLSVAMKTTLGLYAVLKLPPLALGLLCNRNRITLVAGYKPVPDSDQSIIVETKSFDVCNLMQALALRVTLGNYAAHAQTLVDIVKKSRVEIAAPFLDESFVSWRHDSALSSLDSESESEEVDNAELVENWLKAHE